MSSIRVRVDLTKFNQKLSHQNLLRGRQAMANQALSDMNHFVPHRSGKLRGSGHVTMQGASIVWNTPYAHRQFTNMMNNYTTPGTGPHWDKKAAGVYRQSWINAFKRGAGI